MVIDPRQIRIIIREATAFGGHSFAVEDEKIVEQMMLRVVYQLSAEARNDLCLKLKSC